MSQRYTKKIQTFPLFKSPSIKNVYFSIQMKSIQTLAIEMYEVATVIFLKTYEFFLTLMEK